MAKIAFSKLGLKSSQDIKIITFNDLDIEVKQYLPVNDKLELISNVINKSADDNNFANPVKVKIYKILEIIYAYTNISFTDKQKEDVCKLYDLIISSGLYSAIISAIPADEVEEIAFGILDSVDAVYKYRNSVMGILDIISTDYSNLNFDASNIQKSLSDPDNLTLLKDVLTKLG